MKHIRYYVLVGAPNCGKTVLFNGLTGANAKVANYPGVTVDRREGVFVRHPENRVIDLPGTYSLRTTSPDETVARDVVIGKLGKRPDAVIAVADATNLRMTLRMILELKTLGLPMVVSLNMIDVAKSRGLNIDADKLSRLLGVKVLETAAVRSESVEAVYQAALELAHETPVLPKSEDVLETLEALDSEQLYQEVEDILKQVVRTEMVLPEWHRRLDALFLHPVWGVVILLAILLLVFQGRLFLVGAVDGCHRRHVRRIGRMGGFRHAGRVVAGLAD